MVNLKCLQGKITDTKPQNVGGKHKITLNNKQKDIMDWSILIPEQINRLIFIHHIIVIGLAITCAILWGKVSNLSKQIKELKKGKNE